MEFITITQYFNKLQAALFLLLLVPLLVFIALYFVEDGTLPDSHWEYSIISAAVLTNWLVTMIISAKKIKSARNEQGLGAKLEKYFGITVVRFSFLSAGNLLLAVGLYLTGSDAFTALYVAGLVLSAILWPTGKRVSKDLKLRGDEREMVYFKRDTF